MIISFILLYKEQKVKTKILFVNSKMGYFTVANLKYIQSIHKYTQFRANF